MAPAWKGMLRSAVLGALAGGAAYVSADVASDIYTVSTLRSKALEVAQGHGELAQLLGNGQEGGGGALRPGPLYATTLAYGQGGHIAHCTFALQGSSRATDVIVRGARRAGYRSNFLYNFLGPGEWELLSCQAMFPEEGGVAAPRHLIKMQQAGAPSMEATLAAVRPGSGAAAAGVHGAHGVEGFPRQQPQAGQQQQQQQLSKSGQAGEQQPEQPKRRWWRWGRGSGGNAPSE